MSSSSSSEVLSERMLARELGVFRSGLWGTPFPFRARPHGTLLGQGRLGRSRATATGERHSGGARVDGATRTKTKSAAELLAERASIPLPPSLPRRRPPHARAARTHRNGRRSFGRTRRATSPRRPAARTQRRRRERARSVSRARPPSRKPRDTRGTCKRRRRCRLTTLLGRAEGQRAVVVGWVWSPSEQVGRRRRVVVLS